MTLNVTHSPPPFLDPHFISHYRVVLVIFSIISNVFTIVTLVALYHKQFHLRRVIFLSILFPNLLLTYTFLILQPLIILPHPIVHFFGPLPFSGSFQLLTWAFLLITTLAVFAYSLLYIFFTAILRNNAWNQLTMFLLAGLVLVFTGINSFLVYSCNEQPMPLSHSLIFPHSTVNYTFVEYLVLLMMGCGIVTFTIERYAFFFLLSEVRTWDKVTKMIERPRKSSDRWRFPPDKLRLIPVSRSFDKGRDKQTEISLFWHKGIGVFRGFWRFRVALIWKLDQLIHWFRNRHWPGKQLTCGWRSKMTGSRCKRQNFSCQGQSYPPCRNCITGAKKVKSSRKSRFAGHFQKSTV